MTNHEQLYNYILEPHHETGGLVLSCYCVKCDETDVVALVPKDSCPDFLNVLESDDRRAGWQFKANNVMMGFLASSQNGEAGFIIGTTSDSGRVLTQIASFNLTPHQRMSLVSQMRFHTQPQSQPSGDLN